MPSATNGIRVRMSGRPIDEPHRVSSPLELLFDLTFVVAIAAVTTQLTHSIADGHGLAGLVPFLQVFFAVWWAWMNFTWFASSYDTDDVAYRLLTMVQMAGVLVLAAGVPAAGDHSDYQAVTLGYFVMRIGLVSQWLRAANFAAPAALGASQSPQQTNLERGTDGVGSYSGSRGARAAVICCWSAFMPSRAQAWTVWPKSVTWSRSVER